LFKKIKKVKKNKEINANKIYRPSGKFAEPAKKWSSPADYLRTDSVDLDQLYSCSFDRHMSSDN